MKDARDIVKNFCIDGEIEKIKPLGNGHINSTFLVVTNKAKYTVQAINKFVFKDPVAVMKNIVAVTEHIRKKLIAEGKDADRGVLNVIPAKDGKYYYIDEEGEYWRVYTFIDDAYTVEVVEDPAQLYNAGLGFGNFQKMISDFPIDQLEETIKDFHNTPVRYEQLMAAAERNSCNRLADVSAEMEYFKAHKEELALLANMQKEGRLPLRVTHNDTKINNILMDSNTNEILSVIDLDTVMPGLIAYDFGDTIRFAGNTAEEDETDLSRVSVDLVVYENFVKGFLEALNGSLNKDEIDTLAWGAKIVTMENAMRFLADHLDGDKYFKIHKENHNLDRARCQIALAKSMEENFEQMLAIVKKYAL